MTKEEAQVAYLAAEAKYLNLRRAYHQGKASEYEVGKARDESDRLNALCRELER